MCTYGMMMRILCAVHTAHRHDVCVCTAWKWQIWQGTAVGQKWQIWQPQHATVLAALHVDGRSKRYLDNDERTASQ